MLKKTGILIALLALAVVAGAVVGGQASRLSQNYSLGPPKCGDLDFGGCVTTLTVHVSDTGGNPVDGALAKLFYGSGEFIYESPTGEDGSHLFRWIFQPRSYYVTVEKFGYVDVGGPKHFVDYTRNDLLYSIPKGVDVTLRKLPRKIISFKASDDETNLPLEQVNGELTFMYYDSVTASDVEVSVGNVFSDVNGLGSFGIQEPGHYKISTSLDGYFPNEVEFDHTLSNDILVQIPMHDSGELQE